ncbi:MAG: hypothetical protein GY894_08475 [Planctomycetes bacterium]|nr:hypothetical protein [Planctomycetota bacterium]MCP4839377.1 hypothetical protein [Planctomycetota bacterium]
MTSEHISIPSHELAEMAILDAYGLLESPEQVRFEQAFLALTPDVQAEIRRIQEEIATDERLLPSVNPPEHLRVRTLGRIHAAMALNSAGLVMGEYSAQTSRNPMQFAPQRSSFIGSVWTWRMAALILLGVCLTLVVTSTSSKRHFDRMMAEAVRLQTGQTIERSLGENYAPFLKMMNSPTAQHRYLAAADGQGFVRVSIDEKTGECFLFAMDLMGHDGPCTVDFTSSDGSVQRTALLRTDRVFDSVAIQFDPNLLAGTSVRISDAAGVLIAKAKLV